MADIENAGNDRGTDYEVGYGKPPRGKPFEKGNKAGSQKRNGYHLKALLKKLLATINKDDPKRRSYAEAFVQAEFTRAYKKGGDSAKRVWEYIEGKPKQVIGIEWDKVSDEELLAALRGVDARAAAGSLDSRGAAGTEDN